MASQAPVLTKGSGALTQELTDHAAIGGTVKPSALLLTELNPTSVWLQMMSNAAAAIDHYCEMEEKDAHLVSVLETRKEGVLSKQWRVAPDEDGGALGERIADEVWRNFEGLDNFAQVLYELLDALGKGVAIAEILYARDGGSIVIDDVRFRKQNLFAFGALSEPPVGPLRIWNARDELLPENKFIVHSFRPLHGNRWGRPLNRRVWWAHWIKQNTVREWLHWLEKGNGTVMATYRQGADQKEREAALTAAEEAHARKAIAKAEGFVLEVLDKARTGTSGDYKDMVENYSNREMSKAILGQTLTITGSDQGSGSRALGEVHNEVRAEKIESDARSLMAVINWQLIRPLVTLNFGPDAPMPRFVIEYEEGEDLQSLATVGKTIVDMGVPLAAGEVRERFGWREPEGDEATTERAAAGPAAPALFAELPRGVDDAERITLLGVERGARVIDDWLREALRQAAEGWPETEDEL